MPKMPVHAENLYRMPGPYIQAVETTGGKLLFTSGYLGRNKDGKIVGEGDIALQSRQCIKNLEAAIQAAGGSLDDIVRLNVFISHPRLYDGMNSVRKEMLSDIVFTSVTVVGQIIDPHGLVEMDAIAVIGST